MTAGVDQSDAQDSLSVMCDCVLDPCVLVSARRLAVQSLKYLSACAAVHRDTQHNVGMQHRQTLLWYDHTALSLWTRKNSRTKADLKSQAVWMQACEVWQCLAEQCRTGQGRPRQRRAGQARTGQGRAGSVQ